MTVEEINTLLSDPNFDTSEISDGFHTFSELYAHRCVLFIALARMLNEFDHSILIWRSKNHNDGSTYENWFLLGIHTDFGKQISYHIPDKMWEYTKFAQTLEFAPPFDGHTSKDVIARIITYMIIT